MNFEGLVRANCIINKHMSKFIYFVFSLVVVGIRTVYADQDVESSDYIHHSIMSECADKFGVTDHDYRTALTSGNVDAIDPCFWSCCFKGTGVFNAEGLYDLEATLPFIKTTFHDDNYKQVQKIATLCEKVNNEIINKGEAECVRAALLVSCFLVEGGDRSLH